MSEPQRDYPVGTIFRDYYTLVYFIQTDADSCVKADGAEYKRKKYPALYAIIGRTYGGSRWRRTFRVPNMEKK